MAIFTGKRVETAGLIIASIGTASLLHGGALIGAAAGIGVYLLDRFKPSVFNWLSNFAEPTTWPGYVALGVAAICAAHQGGWRADVVLAGLLTAGDGRMFDSLY